MRAMRLALTSLSATALAGATPAPAAPPAPAAGAADRWEPIPAAIGHFMQRWPFPAVSAAIVQDGRIVYEQAFGVADVENEVPATARSVFRIASISKPITATAVMQLVEEGKIDLAGSIRAYVPTLPATYDPVTVADLLRHSGGVRHYKDRSEFITTRTCSRLSEALDIFAADPLDHPPGERVTYTTWGYVLLGLAVEQASGIPYLDYVRTRILEPAGMTETRADTLEIIPRRASGYTQSGGRSVRNASLLDTSCRIPGGGFVSTAGDLARFSIALDGGLLVKPETLAQMSRSQLSDETYERSAASAQVPPGRKFPHMGFGWVTEEKDGVTRVHHAGLQPWASAIVYRVPSRGTTVIIPTNLDGKGPQVKTLAEAIAGAAIAP